MVPVPPVSSYKLARQSGSTKERIRSVGRDGPASLSLIRMPECIPVSFLASHAMPCHGRDRARASSQGMY
jgi:hypothetical protein